MGPSIRLWPSNDFYFLPLSIASKCTVKLRAASVAYTDSGVRTQDWERKEEAAR